MKTQASTLSSLIIGRPLNGKGDNNGFINVPTLNDGHKFLPIKDISDITSGPAVTTAALKEHGVRVGGVNLKFTYNEATYYVQTNIMRAHQCFHLAAQGYSIDATPIMCVPDVNSVLPLLHPIGSFVEGKGIYAGLYEPEKRLGRIFNVYAAPENLTLNGKDTFVHKQAVAAIRSLENWHGHDGSPTPTESQYDGSRNHLSKWRLPNHGSFKGDSLKKLAEALALTEINPNALYMGAYKDCDDWVYYYNAGSEQTAHTMKDNVPMYVRPVRYELYDMPVPPKM